MFLRPLACSINVRLHATPVRRPHFQTTADIRVCHGIGLVDGGIARALPSCLDLKLKSVDQSLNPCCFVEVAIGTGAVPGERKSRVGHRQPGVDAPSPAAQAEFDAIKKVMVESQRVENKNSSATRAAEMAHLRAEAATAQAKADKELFEQTQALRAEYAGQ